jgi:hypothetical protein
MTRRTFITIMMICLILPINELWQIWDGDPRIVSSWLHSDITFNIQWYFKFLFGAIANVLKAGVIVRMSNMNQYLRIASMTYLTYTIMDVFFFLLKYNQFSYVTVYGSLGLVATIIIYVELRIRQPKRKKKQRSLKNDFNGE